MCKKHEKKDYKETVQKIDKKTLKDSICRQKEKDRNE